MTITEDRGLLRFERPALLGIVALAVALRAWGLEQNGWGAEYYSAAVRSMALDWHNFFFAAFDPEGFISVDKPPVALWLQVLAVKLMGFHPLAVLAPQVLEGVASVWLLHHLVRRNFNAVAALLAALFFATAPVWVAVNRTNNMDSCLLLVLLLAAWALLQAAEDGSRRRLMLAMAGVGIAFNVKMLAAYIVLPAFFLAYLLGAPAQWKRRCVDLLLAGLVLLAVSLPWFLAYELTPPDQRPYVGSSRNNSMLELVVGHNAFSRFFKPGPAAQAPAQRPEPRRDAAEQTADDESAADPRSQARLLWQRLYVREPAGPWRLAGGQLAAQAAWLLPLALAGLLFGGRAAPPQSRKSRDGAANPARLALWFWLCWTVTYWIVYSSLGGIVHFYYLSTLAPALAALAGIGLAALWDLRSERSPRAMLLPAALLLTAAWQAHVQSSAMGWPLDALWMRGEWWLGMLHLAAFGGACVAALAMMAGTVRQRDRPAQPPAWGAFAVAITAILTLPIAWALSSVLLPGQGVLPSADLYRLVVASRAPDAISAARFGQTVDSSPLTAFLSANRNGERFLLATSTTRLAAPIIIESGDAVMARGGFHGLDAATSPEKLARMVEAGELRFAMLRDLTSINRNLGAEAAGKPVADWIVANGKRVDPRLWGGWWTVGPRLYDLRPDPGLRPSR